jgi:hypothetical protein
LGHYLHSIRFVVDAPDLCVSNIFRVVEICMSQDLRFVSSTIVICISIVTDFELISSKETDIAYCQSMQELMVHERFFYGGWFIH